MTVNLFERIVISVIAWTIFHAPRVARIIEPLYYHFRCPRPIDDHRSPRACFLAGYCGCSNADRFR